MSSDELQLNNLEIYHQRKELMKATAEQIVKDFSLLGHELNIPENAPRPYSHLYDQVEKVIYRLITSDFNQLMNVLYRIDIDEHDLRMHLASTHEDSSELLARLVIERELKKVVVRWHYSGKL